MREIEQFYSTQIEEMPMNVADLIQTAFFPATIRPDPIFSMWKAFVATDCTRLLEKSGMKLVSDCLAQCCRSTKKSCIFQTCSLGLLRFDEHTGAVIPHWTALRRSSCGDSRAFMLVFLNAS